MPLNNVKPQAAQTLFVIYIRESIALRFEPFKRMYETGSKITCNDVEVVGGKYQIGRSGELLEAADCGVMLMIFESCCCFYSLPSS